MTDELKYIYDEVSKKLSRLKGERRTRLHDIWIDTMTANDEDNEGEGFEHPTSNTHERNTVNNLLLNIEANAQISAYEYVLKLIYLVI